MSSSWANIIAKAPVPVKKTVTTKEEVEIDVVNTDKCTYERNFMDYFGYKTSLLWERLQDKKISKSLFCKSRSSSKFHEFLFDNLELLPEQVGLIEDDSDEESETEEFVE